MAKIVVKRDPNGIDPVVRRTAEQFGRQLLKTGQKMLRTLRQGFILQAKRVRDGLAVVEVIDPPVYLLAAGANPGGPRLGAAVMGGRVFRMLPSLSFPASPTVLRVPFAAYYDPHAAVLRSLGQFPGAGPLAVVQAHAAVPVGACTVSHVALDPPLQSGSQGAAALIELHLGVRKYVNNVVAGLGLWVSDTWLNAIESGYVLVPRHSAKVPLAESSLYMLPYGGAWFFLLKEHAVDHGQRSAVAARLLEDDETLTRYLVTATVPAWKPRGSYDVTGLPAQLLLRATITVNKGTNGIAYDISSLFYDFATHPTSSFRPDTSVPADDWADSSYRFGVCRVLGSEVGFVPDPIDPEGVRAVALTVVLVTNTQGNYRHTNTLLVRQDDVGAFSYLQSNLLWKEQVDIGPFDTPTGYLTSASGVLTTLGSCHYNGAWYCLLLEVSGSFTDPYTLGIDPDPAPDNNSNPEPLRERYFELDSYRIRTIKMTEPGVYTQVTSNLSTVLPTAAPPYLMPLRLDKALSRTDDAVVGVGSPTSIGAYVGAGMMVLPVRNRWQNNGTTEITLGFFDLALGQFVTLIDATTNLPVVQQPLLTFVNGQSFIRNRTTPSSVVCGPQRCVDVAVALTVDQLMTVDEFGRVLSHARIHATHKMQSADLGSADSKAGEGLSFATDNASGHRTVDGGQTWVKSTIWSTDNGYWDLGSATIPPPTNDEDRGF